MKNLVLGYLHAPDRKKPEVLGLISKILGFTPEELYQVGGCIIMCGCVCHNVPVCLSGTGRGIQLDVWVVAQNPFHSFTTWHKGGNWGGTLAAYDCITCDGPPSLTGISVTFPAVYQVLGS